MLAGYASGSVTGQQISLFFNIPIYGRRLNTIGKAVGGVLEGMGRADLYPMGDSENVLIIDMEPQIDRSSTGFVRVNQWLSSILGIERGPIAVANGTGENCAFVSSGYLAPIGRRRFGIPKKESRLSRNVKRWRLTRVGKCIYDSDILSDNGIFRQLQIQDTHPCSLIRPGCCNAGIQASFGLFHVLFGRLSVLVKCPLHRSRGPVEIVDYLINLICADAPAFLHLGERLLHGPQLPPSILCVSKRRSGHDYGSRYHEPFVQADLFKSFYVELNPIPEWRGWLVLLIVFGGLCLGIICVALCGPRFCRLTPLSHAPPARLFPSISLASLCRSFLPPFPRLPSGK